MLRYNILSINSSIFEKRYKKVVGKAPLRTKLKLSLSYLEKIFLIY
jgi:DNA replication initiation complex subunit (GINS family)